VPSDLELECALANYLNKSDRSSYLPAKEQHLGALVDEVGRSERTALGSPGAFLGREIDAVP
jgi:hypothetical protein